MSSGEDGSHSCENVWAHLGDGTIGFTGLSRPMCTGWPYKWGYTVSKQNCFARQGDERQVLESVTLNPD